MKPPLFWTQRQYDMRRAAKIDDNQNEIVKAFRNLGAYVLITSQLKNAFDCLVGFRGNLYVVEIKDGKKPPSKRKLTSGEKKCKSKLNAVGVEYNIVKDLDDVQKLLFSDS